MRRLPPALKRTRAIGRIPQRSQTRAVYTKTEQKQVTAWLSVRNDAALRRRERSGMTFAELARRLGIAQSTLSRWDSGQREPRCQCLERVREELDPAG